jgi:hypothetical protein
MALKANDMYWRMFIDSKLRIFTITVLPLSEPTHQEFVASEATLRKIVELLVDDGWIQCQRKAFEMCVRNGSV